MATTVSPVAHHTVTAADHETHYLELGTGRPLVLLHGSGPGVSAESNWSGVLPDLARRFRVLAPDMAGFGETELKPDADYGIKLWVRQLVDFLDAVGAPSAVLVGNSFGGGLSLATALRHRERVDGMVLLGTPAGSFPMSEGLRSGWFYEPDRSEMERILRLFPFDQELVTADMIESRFLASARPGAQAAYRRLIPEPGDLDTQVHGVPESSLTSIHCPTLVLHGREDRVIPVEVGWRLATHIPDAQLHVFGRCGHWVQLERRDEFVHLVSDFAGRLP